MTAVIVADKKYDCEHLLGQFLDESHFDTVITEATDFYAPSLDGTPSEDVVVFKYRPGFFSQEEMDMAYSGLREAAQPTENRGLASGPRGEGGRDWLTEYQVAMFDHLCNPQSRIDGVDTIQELREKRDAGGFVADSRGYVWLVQKVGKGFDFDAWVDGVSKLPEEEMVAEAISFRKETTSDTSYANAVFSGIAGSFGRYPRIPYGRLTSFTENNMDSYAKCFPFMKSLGDAFSGLLPERAGKQKAFINNLDPKYVVPDTPFTTITVNKTFRTAAHRDAGDLDAGFSNLCVLSNGKEYKGGWLILPEFRAAVAVKPGDLLLIGNHDYIHGNTPIELVDPEAERISLVCYAREDMGKLGEFDYEQTRREFVDYRRLNPEHPLQRERWNGVSPGMWSDNDAADQDWEAAREWYDYLKCKEQGERWLDMYHPWLKERFEASVALGDFFG